MKILLSLILFATATIATAADPFDGTWRQSNDLSGGQAHRNHNEPPAMQIKVVGNKAIIHDSDYDYSIEFKLDGTPIRIKEGNRAGNDITLLREHPNVWRYRRDPHGTRPFTQGGHFSVSANGKILTKAILRAYEDGSTKYYFRVYEKQ